MEASPCSAPPMTRSTTSTRETGATIEVFYADRALETFGRCGSGWFWWSRQRGFAPEGLAYRPVCYELRSVSARDELQVA